MRSQQLLYIQAISHQASVTSAMREGKKIAQYSHQDREQVISKNPAKDEFDETQGISLLLTGFLGLNCATSVPISDDTVVASEFSVVTGRSPVFVCRPEPRRRAMDIAHR